MVLAFPEWRTSKKIHTIENWDICNIETKIEPIYTDKESVEYKRALKNGKIQAKS
jgi:hypothetical protein